MKRDDELLKIAQEIAGDIYQEHGEEVHGKINMQDARETVECYGYEGEELEKISRYLVVEMEGFLE